MSSNEKDDSNLPPSYSESLHPSFTASSTGGVSPGQSLLDILTLTRASTIRSTIHTSILPLLSSRAALGIPHTTIALLPSDIPLPSSRPGGEKNEFSFDSYGLESREKRQDIEVLSSDGEESPQVIRLTGDVNSTSFWRQPAVISELERQLGRTLNDRLITSTSLPQEAREEEKVKRGLFSRRGKQEVVGGKGGGDEEAGQVAVKVQLEEICLRTTNEFGLYDTLSRQCVVVRVDARC